MTGNTVCSYSAIVKYPDKENFSMYSPTMTVTRCKTEQETEEAARKEAVRKVDLFFKKHFPAKTPRPEVVAVKLGSVTFIPDDYEWRRT